MWSESSSSRSRCPSNLRDFFLVRWGSALYLDRLTESGRAFFWIGVLTTAAAMTTFVIKAYFIWCALMALLLVSIPLARWSRVKLEVDYELPRRASARSSLSIPIRVRNRTRRTALDLGFSFPNLPPQLKAAKRGTSIGALAPGEETSLRIELELNRRGHYLFEGLRQESYFPFGVWRDLLLHQQPQNLLVHPWFSPFLDMDIPVGRRYQPGGVALSSNVGESTEFLGTREYRFGDNVRDIHWRSWARIGKPVVKEFQEEYFCRIALILDTFLPEESERDDFEAALSIAAAVSDYLAEGEYIIDLFAAGPELYSLQAGRNIAHLENVLDVLACLEPCREPPFQRIAPVLLDNMVNTTTAILVLLDWDENREGLARVVRDHGPAIKTLMVRSQAPTLDPSGAEELLGPVTMLSPEDVWNGVDRC